MTSRRTRLRGESRGGRAAAAALIAGLVLGASACSGGEAPAPTPSASSSSATPSRTATPTPAPPTRPSGMLWDSGVVGHKVAITEQFVAMRGRPIDVLGVSPTRDTWETLYGTWWEEPRTVPPNFRGTLNVALPLFPDDGNLADAAAGKYDAQWKHMAQLIAKRYPTAYVRPGWEMNIHNWKWAATPENVGEYQAAFRHAVTSMRSVAPHLRIVWNVNEGKGDTLPDASLAWPGDEYVDIVGMDAYDWSPAYDEKGWQKHLTKDQGWDYWANFARRHGKKFALPEWGVIAGNEDSGGDNPQYIDHAYGWMQANADVMAFESYFQEPEDYCRCALFQNPQAQAAYRAWMPKLLAPKG